MIGKHVSRPKKHSSFKRLNEYITGKTSRQPGEKIAYTGCLNLASVETATVEMESLAFHNTRCADPVMHLLLSWRENEVPTAEQALTAVKITLGELNLSQCQVVYSLHQNTDNLHLHICVNRIDPETMKAIDPAHGWTRRAMERAARRIEHAQGWKIEENAWSEINGQGEAVQKPMKDGVKVPQKVGDMENLTGEQSAIRKAQEALKDRIKNFSSWEELNNAMSLNGMKYQKKGSGAVIVVGDVTIKASRASRNLTLKNLEKQLGPYREIHHLAEYIYRDTSKNHAPKPLDEANRNNAAWKAYITARNDYYGGKKERRENLSMTQRKERSAMKKRQSDERKALAESLKKSAFPKHEVYRQKNILRTQHTYESAVLKQTHKEQRGGIQKQNPAYQSYEQWLRAHGMEGQAEEWRHRKDRKYLRFESPDEKANEITVPVLRGIPGFTMMQTGQGVKFQRAGSEQASFIDTGRVIRVYREDNDSLLAALQLAQEKWGGVKLNGSAEYKRRCAEIAASNGIRVANPELQGLIKEIAEHPRPKAAEVIRQEGADGGKERLYRLIAKAKELLRTESGENFIIATNAVDGKEYSGKFLGVISEGGRYIAAQAISSGHVIMHDVEKDDLPALETLQGRRAVMTSDDCSLRTAADADLVESRSRNRDRDWSR